MSFLTLVWNRFRKTFRNWCYILFSLFVSRSNCFWWRYGYFRVKFSNFVQWIYYAEISGVWPGYSCVRLFKYFLPTSFLVRVLEVFLVEVLLMFWKMSNCYWSDSRFRWRRESSQNIPPGWILTTNTELKYDWWNPKALSFKYFHFRRKNEFNNS